MSVPPINLWSIKAALAVALWIGLSPLAKPRGLKAAPTAAPGGAA